MTRKDANLGPSAPDLSIYLSIFLSFFYSILCIRAMDTTVASANIEMYLFTQPLTIYVHSFKCR